MSWRKLGLLVEPPAGGSWCRSHAMVPFARTDADGVGIPNLSEAWLHFSARDGEGRSATGRACVQLDPRDPRVEVEPEPLVVPGPPGTFDCDGAMGSCLVEHEGRLHLFYIGWSRSVTVPFHTFVGCAVSSDGGLSYEKVSPAPVIGRSRTDPILATSPWVLVEEGRWRMWYASGVAWDRLSDGTLRHRYLIRHAESDDGVAWRASDRVAIDFEGPEEYAIARPCVVRDEGRYTMWFSHRGDAYRIGVAESDDGLAWSRLEEPALVGGPDAWDAGMVEYPFVLEWDGRRYMLHNGNGYGETGIGLAVLEQ